MKSIGAILSLILLSISPMAFGQFSVNNSFVPSITSSCDGDTLHISFTPPLSGPFTFQWNQTGAAAVGINTDSVYTIVTTYGSQVSVFVTLTSSTDSIIDTLVINVNAIPAVSLVFSDAYACYDESPFLLSGGLPSGGYYTGPGVFNNVFTPSQANLGPNIIQYVYQMNGCTGIDTDTIHVLGQYANSISIDGGAATSTTNFNGQTVWHDCISTNSNTIGIYNSLPNTVASYVINFADGSPLISGIGQPPNPISHTYAGQGLYNGTLTVVSDSGCTTILSFNYFFGSNPSIGLGNPGSTTGCLSPGDSLTYTFPLTNYSSNPPGTMYVLEFNDGSAPDTLFHPPPASYTHSFFSTSCGASPQGTTPNTYYCRIRATNPCATSIATVEPIIVSERTRSEFQISDTVCLNAITTVSDISQGGTNVSNNGATCDTTHKIIWKISPSSFIVSGGSLGSQPGGALNPNVWTSGSQNPQITFTAPGIYSITQIVGIAGGCSIDSSIRTICVQEEISSTSITVENLGSTLCSPTSIRLNGSPPLNSFCEANLFQWAITPSTFTVDSGSVSSSKIKLTLSDPGTYVIAFTKSNSCSSETVYDTVIIRQSPFLDFIDSVFYCNETLVQFFGQTAHTPLFNNGNDVTSFQYSITPPVGWTLQTGSLNTSNPAILFSQSGLYAVTLTATNSCGSSQSTQYISISTPPNLSLTIPDTICIGGILNASLSISGVNNPYQALWIIGNDTIIGSVISGIVLSSNTLVQIQAADSRGCITTIDTIVRVYNAPIIVNSIPSFCDSDTIVSSLIVSGGEGPFSFEWDTSAGLSDSTLLNPVFFGPSVLPSYILTVTDRIGCQYAIPFTIPVFPPPLANAGADTIICQGDSILLGDVLSDPSLNYSWTSNPPGFVSTQKNPLVAPSLSNRVFYLNVSSGINCESTDSIIVQLSYSPTSDFALPDTVCSGEIIALNDANLNVFSRQWVKNGNAISTNGSYSDTVANYGSAIVSVSYELTTTNINGCDSSTTKTVYVRPEGKLSFSSSNVCRGDTNHFYVQFSSGYSFSSIFWEFGGGINASGDSVSHYFLNPGSYAVTVSGIDQYGCNHQHTGNVLVYSNPTSNFTLSSTCNADTICVNKTYTFNDLSQAIEPGATVAYWYWDFDSDGVVESTIQSPSYSFPNSGLQQVSLIVESSFGCLDTLEREYYVLEPLFAEIYLSEDSVCGPYTISDSLYQTGLVEYYEWQLYRFSSSGNKIIEFVSTDSIPVLPTAYNPPGGSYTWYWSLEVSNCCDTLEVIDSVRLGSIPIPNFQITPDTGCSPLLVDFQLDGLILGSPDYILLDFGDGTTDSLTPTPLLINGVWQYIWGQVNHVYQYTGANDTIYYATVLISNGCGDSSMIVPVFVQANTVQSFFNSNTSSGCAPLIVNFNNYSFAANNFSWCFDYDSISGICNGAVSNAPNPTHTFNTPGTYLVSLISDNGCSYDTAYQTIVASSGISAQINPIADHCVESPISLSVQILNNPTITSYFWDFGDGQSSTLSNPNHTYSAPGSFNISLALQTISGCVDTFYTSATAIAKPTTDFGYYNLCFNAQPIQFFDSTQSNGTLISGTLWDFGDGNSSTLINPIHIYSLPGTYLVTLIKFSSFGCSDTIQHQIIVYPEPQLDFQPILISNDSCGLPQTYEFVNLSTNSFGFNWDFDFLNPGTSTSTLNQPTFSFNQAGTYTIALIGSNAFGCSDTIYQTMIIRPQVSSFFTINPETACEGTVFSFQDNSQSDSINDPIVNWLWDFGDGNSIFGNPIVQHTYQFPGIYIVQLSVETASGCTDNTYTSIAQVLERPTANIGISNQALRLITFDNNSTFLVGNPSFIWDFGDGYASSDFELSHVYQSSGEYWVHFEVENENGCKDTTLIRVFIDDSFTLFIPNSFTPNEDGKNEIFYVQGMGIDEIEIVIFNRWGQRVFYSNDIALGWDGLVDGKEANQDTYVVKVSAKNYLYNKIEKKTSLLHLIR